MHSIIETLASKAQDFIRLYGREPENLYLGHTEWLELKATIEFRKQFSPIVNPPKFKGLNIFRIMADTHISLG